MRTTDAGATWTRQDSGTTQDLNAVHFDDAATGTFVGNLGTIVRTTDGGKNWVLQSAGSFRNIGGLSFINANEGWITNREILHTTDGGDTWTTQYSQARLSAGGSISFADERNGLATVSQSFPAGGAIIRTNDGGLSWSVVYGAGHFNFVSYVRLGPGELALAIRIGLGGPTRCARQMAAVPGLLHRSIRRDSCPVLPSSTRTQASLEATIF